MGFFDKEEEDIPIETAVGSLLNPNAGIGPDPYADSKIFPELDNIGESNLDFLEGFLASAAYEGTLGLVGIDAPTELERWQENHQYGSLISAFLGIGGAYGAYMKVASPIAKKLPITKNMIAAAELPGSKLGPALGGASKTIAELAPFEVGRLAIAASIGDE